MGVHGLWDLLAPVGRRVSVETLAGKKLAIDASIWMVQFMKAMRDEKGEMVRNAHLLGFFRRICKLLYLKTKPVFVFDGATPILKRRTVIARRRQRENAQAKIRKTAEKLLLNQLKQMRVKELAKDLENQRKVQKSNGKGKKISSDKLVVESNAEVKLTNSNNVKLKEKLEVPIAEGEGSRNENNDEDEEIMLPEIEGSIDPDVFAALPLSMQHQILSQNDAKGKKKFSIDFDESNIATCNTKHDAMASITCNQEKMDEMLAASLAAQEDGNFANDASTSAAAVPSEDGDEDEEMILPAMHGNIDPNVLAALPPSLQLDLLVQMREKLMAENRQKYQKVKKAPEKFSELQIQSYLKTVAFRREIDEVQKTAAGKGVAGVQTSRIASEANREFIFSSSFTGDKQVLTSARKEKNEDKQQEIHSNHPSDSLNGVNSISKSNLMTESVPNESNCAPDEDVGTYFDERGCVRVSRMRGMGIRMTRDLQRNLDLMKEVEQGRTNSNNSVDVQSVLLDTNKIVASKSLSCDNQFVETLRDGNCESVNLNESNWQSVFKNDTCMEITFEADRETRLSNDDDDDDDDDIFARLAAGDPVTLPLPVEESLRKQTSDSGSDCEWEEGTVEANLDGLAHGVDFEYNPSNKEGNITDGSEVEWEGEPSDAPKSSSVPVESVRVLSKGHLQEEADLQEAIRRSLTDLGVETSNYLSSRVDKFENIGKNLDESFGSLHKIGNMDGLCFPGDNANLNNESSEHFDGFQKLFTVHEPSISEKNNSPESLSPIARNYDKSRTQLNKPYEISEGPRSEQPRQSSITDSVSKLEKEVDFFPCKSLDVSNEVDGLSAVSDHWTKDSSCASEAVLDDVPSVTLVDKNNNSEGEPSNLVSDSGVEAECIEGQDKKIDFEAKSLHQSVETVDLLSPLVLSSVNKATSDIRIEQELAGDRTNENCATETNQDVDMFTNKGNDDAKIEFTKATLDEEMLILGQEYMDLGDEQRKLERNAESVSSEMFAECQELLQMFGLPYIIAPMEAEAQCAYMELGSLVDGVVTDDSDVFLFGARSVYKNIFDDRKYVETYFMEDIEKELGLTREKLIRIALLLGSDYTEGVSGIGIVNAIEVVNAFPEENGLQEFREWVESPDAAILGKLNVQGGPITRKRGSKSSDRDVNSANISLRGTISSMEGASSTDQNIFQIDKNKQSTDSIDDIKQIFMDKHRNVSKNWHLPSSFPSEAVISAYTSPQVDKSTEPFTWGRPDLFVLRKLCWEKFGWGSQKTDELLMPVLREYEKRETQLRLEAFYTFNERFAKIRSKRIKKAVKGITGNQSSELIDDTTQQVSKGRKKRRISLAQSGEFGDNMSGVPSQREEDDGSRSQGKSMDKSVTKPSRRKQNPRKHGPSEVNTQEPPLQAARKRKANKQSPGDGRVSVHGAGRRRHKARRSEQSENSSSGGDSGNDYEKGYEKLEQPQEVRRSMRTRNPVNYTVNDLEDEVGLSNKQSSGEGAMEKAAAANDLINENSTHEVPEPYHDDLSREYLERGGGFCIDETEIDQPGFCIDETENDQPDTTQDVDPFSEAEASKDYLKVGGGFCIDETQIDQPDTTQDVDPFSEAEASKDYLKVGGGFCRGESETTEDLDVAYYQDPVALTDKGDDHIASAAPSSIAERSLDGFENGKKACKPITELNLDHQNAATEKDDSKGSALLQETTSNNIGTTIVGGLSAMPNLKRKRRKR